MEEVAWLPFDRMRINRNISFDFCTSSTHSLIFLCAIVLPVLLTVTMCAETSTVVPVTCVHSSVALTECALKCMCSQVLLMSYMVHDLCQKVLMNACHAPHCISIAYKYI